MLSYLRTRGDKLMAKTILMLIVLAMFSIGLFIVSKVGVFLKESKKEASDEREGVQLVKK